VKNVGRLWLERRLAHLFGMEAGLARELLAVARRRDDGRLTLRVAAFLVATTRPSRLLVPRAVRERAIRSFAWWLFEAQLYDPRVTLAYTGHPHGLGSRSCPGLRSS
jgi:hypothetical protein